MVVFWRIIVWLFRISIKWTNFLRLMLVSLGGIIRFKISNIDQIKTLLWQKKLKIIINKKI